MQTTKSYATAVAALKIAAERGQLDLSEADLDFVSGDDIWIGTERNRAKNILQQIAYTAIDLLQMPRFDLPAEMWAAVVHKHVHHTNWMIAAMVLEGADTTEEIISGQTVDATAKRIFALVLHIEAHGTELTTAVDKAKQNKHKKELQDA